MQLQLSKVWVDSVIETAMRTPFVHIGTPDDPYMERYWLKPYDERDGTSIRVHRILRSDRDDAFHDHPWPYVSIILRGGYVEHTPQGAEAFTAGCVLSRRASSWHRLYVPEGGEAWTLFMMGPKLQPWGFLDPKTGNKVPWREWIDYHGDYPPKPGQSKNYFEGAQ